LAKKQHEAEIVTSYAGGGAPRFFLAYNPELPDPNFAKMIVSTADERAQSRLLTHLRQQLAAGLVPEARVRASRFVFGPYSPWPVAFRVSGPDIAKVREISNQVLAKMQADPHTRQANLDWGERAPTVHFVLDQDRLRFIGLTSEQASQQIQFLTTGFTVTQVREDIRAVDVVARTSGENRLDPIKLMNMTLQSQAGRPVPLSQVGRVEIRPEEPILKRRDRMPTITVQCDIDDALQPPEVTAELAKSFQSIIDKLPSGYLVEVGASVEEAAKANAALAAVFPIMIVCMLVVIITPCPLVVGSGHDVAHCTIGIGRCSTDSSDLSSAFRIRRHPGLDRTGWHPNAQHADSDWPD
jgi:multidrug efflux pump subunit AcrB